MLVCLALTAVALTQVSRLRFEYNPLELQSRGLASVELARKLISTGDRSVLYAAVSAGSQEEALALELRLRQLPSVAGVESIGRYLAGDQPAKLGIVRDIKQLIAEIELPGRDSGRVNLVNLGEGLFSLQGYLGLISGHFNRNGQTALAAELASLSGGTLILLHVTPPLAYSSMYTGSLTVGLSQQVMAEVHKAAFDTSIAALRAVAERHCGGIEVLFEARPGVPLSVILGESERHKADLIVLAASGRSRVARFFVGSTADRIIREASGPVLVVPAVGPTAG